MGIEIYFTHNRFNNKRIPRCWGLEKQRGSQPLNLPEADLAGLMDFAWALTAGATFFTLPGGRPLFPVPPVAIKNHTIEKSSLEYVK